MRRADMETCLAAGTEVAVGGYEPYQRAVILAVAQDRRRPSRGRSDWGRVVHDGVRVRHLDKGPGTQQAGREEVVAPIHVREKWADYDTSRQAQRDAEAKRSQLLETRRERAQALASALGGSVRVHQRVSAPYDVYGYSVELDLDAADALVAKLNPSR